MRNNKLCISSQIELQQGETREGEGDREENSYRHRLSIFQYRSIMNIRLISSN